MSFAACGELSDWTLRALRRAPSQIRPDTEGANPFNYVRLVQPVLDKNCVGCHVKEAKAPVLSGVLDDKPWSASYRSLKPFAFYYDGGGAFTESRTYPGKFGALASKLNAMLAAPVIENLGKAQ